MCGDERNKATHAPVCAGHMQETVAAFTIDGGKEDVVRGCVLRFGEGGDCFAKVGEGVCAGKVKEIVNLIVGE